MAMDTKNKAKRPDDADVEALRVVVVGEYAAINPRLTLRACDFMDERIGDAKTWIAMYETLAAARLESRTAAHAFAIFQDFVFRLKELMADK